MFLFFLFHLLVSRHGIVDGSATTMMVRRRTNDAVDPSAAEPSSVTPTVSPTFNPTPPATTGFPTFQTPSLAPSKAIWGNVIADKVAIVRIEVPEGSAVSLAALATIWQNYLQNTLQSVYRNSSLVRLEEVKAEIINYEGDGDGRRSRQLRRSLQTTTSDLQANIRVVFQRFLADDSTANFDKQLDSLIESLLQPQNLEQALRDARVETLSVNSVQFPEPAEPEETGGDDDDDDDSEDDDDNDDGPNLIEMIIAFSLLGLAVASLLFWLWVYYKFRQKKAQELDRQDARKNQSTFIVPRQARPRPQQPPPSKSQSQINIDDGASTQSSIHHIANNSSYDGSDPFAQELSFAASMDEEVWQARKSQMERNQRERSRSSTALYPSMLGDKDEGVEMQVVGNITSFPYGDDGDPSLVPQEESAISGISALSRSSQDLLQTDTARARTRKVKFEPYGDGGRPRSRSSANGRSSPYQEDKEQPSSLAQSSSDEPSADAVRNSPRSSATSLSESESGQEDSIGMQLTPLGTDLSDESGEASALDMMKEIAQLSAYVRQYSENKVKEKASMTSRASSRQNYSNSDRQSRQGSSSNEADSPESAKETSYLAGVHSLDTSHDKLPDSKMDTLNSSSDLSMEESDDEESLRLGINRPSVQKPPEYKSHAASSTSTGRITEKSSSSSSFFSHPKPTSLSSLGQLSPSSPDTPPESASRHFSSSSKSQQSPSPLSSSRRLPTPPSSMGPRQSAKNRVRLKNLRKTNRNMLDGDEENSLNGQDIDALPTADESNNNSVREEKKLDDDVQPSGSPRKKKGFSNIVNMFENKPATPVNPPADWTGYRK